MRQPDPRMRPSASRFETGRPVLFAGLLAVSLAALLFADCRSGSGRPASGKSYKQLRYRMVTDQITSRGVRDKRVLEAMRKVKRHLFVPASQRKHAYEDRPLPIGRGQTISQPYIVAYMTEALKLRGKETVLEIGTGSGYQAAILAEVAAKVYTIEIVGPLARRSKQLLTSLGYKNVHFRAGDGYRGWPEAAPFDAIMITASPPKVPEPLLKQLKVGGRLVMPVGEDNQRLIRITRTATGHRSQHLMWVRFVPMTGEVQRR